MSAAPTKPTVTEREARQVAEAARQQEWRKPSFAKELFLGRFRLDLIHPHPMPTDEAAQRGEEFLAKLRDFVETKVDGALIEREARIPDEYVEASRRMVGEDKMAEWEKGVHETIPEMMVISITPTWIKITDFERTYPGPSS